jgi:hypothetical protein
MNPFKDGFCRKAKGKITFTLVQNGRVIKEIVRRNLVVNKGYDLASKWAAGQNFETDRILYAATGTGGHVQGDPTIPIPPSESDTALEIELSRKPILEFTNPSANVARFRTTFIVSESVGMITECGLFSSSGNMFARATFAGIAKGPTLNLIINWDVAF